MAILSNVDNDGGVIMVYTGNSPESIIANGVVTKVRFNMNRAENVKYVVCCQNAELDGATEPHNAAFLIGSVSGFSEPDSEGYRDIFISEYATILKRNAWYAKKQTSHFFFAGLRQAKIRLGRHTFQPIGKAPKGLKKPAQALQAAPIAMKRQEVSTDMQLELRNFIANRLGVKASQVNVTVTIQI